jgi:hypothetical protein
MASLTSQTDERAMRAATRAEKNAQLVSQPTAKESSVKSESSNFDDEEKQCQAGKLAEFIARDLNGCGGTQAFHVIQLEGAEALFMSDIGRYNAESAVKALKEEGHDVHYLSVNFHVLCGGQGYKRHGQSEIDPDDSWGDNQRLLPYEEPPNKEDVLVFCDFQHPANGGFNSLKFGTNSKKYFEEIQSVMACTPEQHNKRASFGSEIDVGHAVVILSVDDDGQIIVDVVRGYLNEGYDAYYEFPGVADIKEVIERAKE